MKKTYAEASDQSKLTGENMRKFAIANLLDQMDDRQIRITYIFVKSLLQ